MPSRTHLSLSPMSALGGENRSLADGVFEFGAALFHARHDGVAQLGHARGIHLGHALELIGNTQLLVLDDTIV